MTVNLNTIVTEVVGSSGTAKAVFDELRSFKKFHDKLLFASFQARVMKRITDAGGTFDSLEFLKTITLMQEKKLGAMVYPIRKESYFKPNYSLRDIALASAGEWKDTPVPAPFKLSRSEAAKARWAKVKADKEIDSSDEVEADDESIHAEKVEPKRGRPVGTKMSAAQKKKWYAARWPNGAKVTKKTKAKKTANKKSKPKTSKKAKVSYGNKQYLLMADQMILAGKRQIRNGKKLRQLALS